MTRPQQRNDDGKLLETAILIDERKNQKNVARCDRDKERGINWVIHFTEKMKKTNFIVTRSLQCRWVERSHDIAKWTTTEEKTARITGFTHIHTPIWIEWSPHYNAEIIYIHWDYLNIWWHYFLCIRPPPPSPFILLHFSVPALFHFLGIDWLQTFFFSRYFCCCCC